VPAGRPCDHNILPVFEDNWRIISLFLSSVNRSSWYPWPTLARSKPTRMAKASQLRTLNCPARGLGIHGPIEFRLIQMIAA
jgi:hypothetical protein